MSDGALTIIVPRIMRGLPVDVIRGMVLKRFIGFNSDRCINVDIRRESNNLVTAEMRCAM